MKDFKDIQKLMEPFQELIEPPIKAITDPIKAITDPIQKLPELSIPVIPISEVVSRNPEFIFTIDEGLDYSFLPQQATEQDTGWDVQAAQTMVIRPTEKVLIPLGLRCFAPPGYWLELRPRSSSFGKKNLHALYGVIDEGYEGQIFFACQWIPPISKDELNWITSSINASNGMASYCKKELVIEKGERIGQLVPVKRQVMNVSSVSAEEFKKLCEERGHKRGAGGFGSSGD